jgi:hypothetical protein
LFATTQTLCDQPDSALEMLEQLPFENICINVGWEAATDAALLQLRKQQTARDVLRGMEKAADINRRCKKLKISGNFICADDLECDTIVDAIRTSGFQGQLYLSPLLGKCDSAKAAADLRSIRRAAPEVKVHLYTMQRM